MSRSLYRGQLDDETRAPLAALVPKVAVVRLGVCARDREPEAGAGDAVARDAGAREPLEQRGLELGRYAGSRVLDLDLHPAWAAVHGDAHRRLAVAEGVRDEIRDDPVD